MNYLQYIDEKFFYFINVTCANPVTDKAMPFITDSNHWIIFYATMWLYMIIKGGRKGLVAGLLIIVCIVISDQLSSQVLKSLFQRVRPCNTLPGVHLLVNCTDSFSFPSSHAVNNFAGAYLFTYFYKELKYFLYIGASIVALSRVFCGVHYPFDILGGMAIGLTIGMLVIYLWKLLDKKFNILEKN